MINMFEKGKKQKGYRYLLQKNARCPICAGTLKHGASGADIIIRCINCGASLKAVDFGVTESELIVEVM